MIMLRKNENILLLVILMIAVMSCHRSHQTETKSRVSSTVSKSVVLEAAKYKGTKYKAAGKTPQGFDCSGYTSYVFRQFDVELSASSSLQAKQGKEVRQKEAKAGDLIFFGRNGRKGKVMHVGIVSKNTAEGLFMWHSSSSKGVIETNVSASSYWKPKILYVRRVL
jgi:lipoprotein Spr